MHPPSIRFLATCSNYCGFHISNSEDYSPFNAFDHLFVHYATVSKYPQPQKISLNYDYYTIIMVEMTVLIINITSGTLYSNLHLTLTTISGH